MRSYGLTKARSMGPVAEMVERSGGSLARVFRRADLPMRLIDEPERLILLKDQLHLVECAAREIGDEALAARLSTEAGFAGLGVYGQRIDAAPSLDLAIRRASATISPSLQSATEFGFEISRGVARWSYAVTDPVSVGRQKNEMLALGYMLDLVRRFAGQSFTPSRLEIAGPPLASRAAAEMVYRCDLARAAAAAIVFPADLLEAPNPRRVARPGPDEAGVPDPADFVACAEQLILLGLLDGRPTVDWLSRRMETPRRTLQRRLAERGASFELLLERASYARARELLRRGAGAMATALELGYSDQAHFTRAFRRWAGMTPREWRRSQENGEII